MRIAAGTDFSAVSLAGVDAAAALADALGAELLVVHQVELALLTLPPPVDVEDIFKAAEGRLRHLLASDPKMAGGEARPLLIREDSHQALSDALEREEVDLFVVASHERTEFRRLLLGSFAERALRYAPCSVLVHHHGGSEAPAPKVSWPARILVPHDLSPASRQAVRVGADWARRFSAKVCLLYVVSLEAGSTGFGPDILGSWRHYQDRTSAVARKELEKIARELFAPLEPEVVTRFGHPVLEILAQAKDHQSDLIIMGTHGRTGVEHFLLGSVAEKTARKAPVSVLTVKGAPGASGETEAAPASG